MIKKSLICILIFACLLMAACKGPSGEPEVTPGGEVTPSVTEEPVTTGESNIKSINYYIADPSLLEIVVETALIERDSEPEPDQIMEFIIDSMADRSVDIDYIGISSSGDEGAKVLTVNFTSDIRNASSYGEEFEKLLLDAVAQSLLDNIGDCMHVSYLIEGEAYKTDNCEYEKGYFYMDR